MGTKTYLLIIMVSVSVELNKQMFNETFQIYEQ
jgi:hypothetical protein